MLPAVVLVPAHRPVAGVAAASSIAPNFHRQLQLSGRRAAQARRDDRARPTRRRAACSRSSLEQLPAAARLHARDVRRRAASAQRLPADGRRRRRHRLGAVGAARDRRHRAADRVRQRRESVSGASGGASAGVRAAGGARRQPRPHRARAALGKRRARRSAGGVLGLALAALAWRCCVRSRRTACRGSTKSRINADRRALHAGASRLWPACCSASSRS